MYHLDKECPPCNDAHDKPYCSEGLCTCLPDHQSDAIKIEVLVAKQTSILPTIIVNQIVVPTIANVCFETKG